MAKKHLKTGCMFLMGAVLLLNLFTMALSGLGLRDRLNWLPGALLAVDSGSMEPILSEGDLLFVWETPYDQLEIGDLVTFHGNNELVTHQIIREEGSRIVTRGAANNVEDASIGPEEYCARVALVIPGAARILEILTNPGTLLLAIMLVLALFYGPSIVLRLTSMMTGEEKQAFRIRPLRLMSAGAVISLLCTTPFVTAAKYTANINEYGSVTAGATYFTSNYLSEEGNIYEINGWNGQAYGMTLYVQNYENDLLYNTVGYDLYYQLEIKIMDETADGTECDTGYSVTLLDSSGNQVEPIGEGKYGPFYIEGADTRKQAQFVISMQTDNQRVMEGGTKIRFQVIASTTSDTDFDRKLLGDFTFEATDATSFLGTHGAQTQVGSALVTYSLVTELVEGASTRDVKVTWNNQKMYLNEYEATAANVIAKDFSGERFSRGTEEEWGYLIIPLHSYSNVKLQFFKHDSNTVVTSSDFTCAEVIPK